MEAVVDNILTKGYQSSLQSTPVEEGKVRFTEDTGQLFLDTSEERIEITDFVKSYTEAEIKEIIAPLPKFYYSSDTHKLFYYADEWVICGEANVDSVKYAEEAGNADEATHAVNADEATHALNADKALDSDHATNSDTSDLAAKATEADHATNADEATHAVNADNALEATHAVNADKALYSDHATNADKADESEKAKMDSEGQIIISTYLSAVVVEGTTIKFTKGDGTSFTVEYVDTTYSTMEPATIDADGKEGLVPAPKAGDQAKFLTGAGTYETPDAVSYEDFYGPTEERDGQRGLVPAPKIGDENKFLKGDGTFAEITEVPKAIEADHATEADSATSAESATNASNDANGNKIDSTYIKEINIEGTKVTVKKGDGNETEYTTQDTTYSDMVAATETEDGVSGLVPAPKANEHDKFLNGSGQFVQPHKANEADHATNADNATNADSAVNATNAVNDGDGQQINTHYAPLASPLFTGKPEAPTATPDDSSNQIANTAFVMEAISDAISKVTQFDTVTANSLSELPETGVKGTIYFVLSGSDETSNIYDQYIWVNSAYEKIGDTRIDLSEYVNDITVSGTGNAVTAVSKSGKKITFTKGATFLTQHPSVTNTSSTGTETPSGGSNISVVDGLTVDANGHVTNFRTKTVTLPDKVSSATSADSATKATQDSAGQQINSTYIKSLSVSGKVITITKGNGTTSTITTQDTNTTYATGTTATAGLTKLYTGTGDSTDGTMTRKAITDALAGKAASSHTHNNITGIQLTSENLNNYTSDGSVKFFYAGESNTVTNNPAGSGQAFGMFVYKNASGYTCQELVSQSGIKYIRYYNGSAWQAWKQAVYSTDTIGAATKATQDGSGNTITSTYIKSLSVSGKVITATRGNGTTFTITTQDTNTTYANMTAATASAAGKAGLVPAPAAGKQTAFLRGDGTWVVPTNTTYSKLPASSVADGANMDFGTI